MRDHELIIATLSVKFDTGPVLLTVMRYRDLNVVMEAIDECPQVLEILISFKQNF